MELKNRRERDGTMYKGERCETKNKGEEWKYTEERDVTIKERDGTIEERRMDLNWVRGLKLWRERNVTVVD